MTVYSNCPCSTDLLLSRAKPNPTSLILSLDYLSSGTVHISRTTITLPTLKVLQPCGQFNVGTVQSSPHIYLHV